MGKAKVSLGRKQSFRRTGVSCSGRGTSPEDGGAFGGDKQTGEGGGGGDENDSGNHGPEVLKPEAGRARWGCFRKNNRVLGGGKGGGGKKNRYVQHGGEKLENARERGRM